MEDGRFWRGRHELGEGLEDLRDLGKRRLDKLDPWDAVLACEPESRRLLTGAALDEALEVAADFADLISPFTAGHSRQVSALAAGACEQAGLRPGDVGLARRVGLVHDLRRTAIPNSIWDKPGALTRAERDRVQLHPLLTGQMLRRASGLRAVTATAACHHEKADGSGYFKGLTSAQLSPAARIVCAADRYQAMTQHCAHRPALSPDAAAAELRRMVTTADVDGDAAGSMLAAAGHAARRRPAVLPAGLTAREAEVLAPRRRRSRLAAESRYDDGRDFSQGTRPDSWRERTSGLSNQNLDRDEPATKRTYHPDN